MSKLFVNLLSGACALMALAGIASAQTSNATIVGDVTDPGGSRIAGAVITVKNTATGVSRELTTNETGSYRVFPLSPELTK